MTKLDVLYELASKSEIQIYDYHASDDKKAFCLHFNDIKTIAMDKPVIQTHAEECVILAEEMGHYETHSLYMIESTRNTQIARSNRIKYEARAIKWAIDEMLPPEEIQKGIRHCDNEYELAEFCQVTVEFLRKAFDYYIQKGLSFTHCKGAYDYA